MYQHPYQTDQTTDLIMLFPDDFPDSATWAEYERQGMEAQRMDCEIEAYIAANYGDCGHPFGYLDNPHEEYMERMAEAYDPGLRV